ncbi:primosomal replication protein PriC [Thalassotalea sp. ND16A]|uniref:primosomal replication protein PriC n=1 Tax=Thalassotalea sp. ND16A TaxID=1535422 RepID=UPI00051DD1F6|nr:primosomal replication protein PriC [Thalassotalea sp. ND16A]KGK00937.1 hypothetical protein ND16A_3139 [Thalassotalea sp. ND16A]
MAQPLHRLKSILVQLAADANAADLKNKQRKSHYYLQDQSLFDEKLFPIASSTYYAYVMYTQKRLEHLQKLMNSNHAEFSDVLLSELEAQISALITAIKSNDNLHHDSEYRLDRRKRLNQQKSLKKYKKAAKTAFAPSHQLYQKLAEYHGFERRLEIMLNDKEAALANTKKHDTSMMQQEVLTLHQRLGRCRRAISDLEKQIELSEKSR